MMGLADDLKVTILVGPEAKAFSLSKKILCSSSAYFAAAFEGNFQEGITQTLNLEEDDVDSFELLIQYIYTREVVLEKDPPNYGETITSYLGLAKIGDKLSIADVVYLAFEELRVILRKNCQRLQRSHLDLVFADDWPQITLGGKVRAFEHLFANAVFEILLGQGVGREKYVDWPLKEVLAEIPGLGSDVSAVTLYRIQKGSESLGAKKLYSALGSVGSDAK